MGLRRVIALLPLLVSVIAWPARADDGWSRPQAGFGDWTVSLGANLSGAVFSDHQGGGVAHRGVQAFAVFTPSLWRTFSSDWEVGAKGSILAWHDNRSGDNYGNDVFELAYLYMQSPYGRIEVGQQNGAAYTQSVGAPLVDGPAAINDANITFFHDPATGLAFIGIFNLRTGVFASANQAKVSYISPRMDGFQLSGSFTPYQTKAVLPWTMVGHHVSDRVKNIAEGNLNYTKQFGSLSLQASTSFAAAHNAARTAGHDDVWDWGLGIETDYAPDDANKLSLGAAYRISNAYAFNIRQAFTSGTTSNFDVGAMWTHGDWLAGIEYETGTAEAVPGSPTLRERGWNPSVAYNVNANLQMTLGWQYLHFHQSAGVFYNGKPGIGMRAAYLHANFQI